MGRSHPLVPAYPRVFPGSCLRRCRLPLGHPARWSWAECRLCPPWLMGPPVRAVQGRAQSALTGEATTGTEGAAEDGRPTMERAGSGRGRGTSPALRPTAVLPHSI
eukprot:10510175-Alexandrium_andersonii.AAC.1